MKKGKTIQLLFFATAILGASSSIAQDLEISLFDDTPNLGRSAPPLDSVLLTPPPLPEIRIGLGNETPAPADTQQPTNTQPLPTLPSVPISLPSGGYPEETPAKPSVEPELPPPPVYDVSTFDLADFSLGMTTQEAFQKALKMGYKVTLTQENIPLFYATDYAYKCRNKGIVIPAQVSQCVKDYACHENTRYISEATLKRKNETIQLFFTSHATDNQLYKIIYINKGDSSLNFTRVNYAKKKLRQKEFWDAIVAKYGNPDDATNLIWGDPQKAYLKAFMTGSAYDAYIIMEDVQLSNEDYFEAEDIEAERPPKNSFLF